MGISPRYSIKLAPSTQDSASKAQDINSVHYRILIPPVLIGNELTRNQIGNLLGMFGFLLHEEEEQLTTPKPQWRRGTNNS
jgi:hypothetical protein